MASSTDKQLTRQANLGAQKTATGIGAQGYDLSGIGSQWGLKTLADQTNYTKNQIDPNAVGANRQAFGNSMDVTQNMIGSIAARPGGYTPGEVASMKLSATAPVAAQARTAQGQMSDRVARTGNGASYAPAVAATSRQAGMDMSGALSGVDAKAAEARRQDTNTNTGLALDAQTKMPGMYAGQMQNEADITGRLNTPVQNFLGLNQTGLQTQLGANSQNVDVAQLLQQVSTKPGLWSQIAAGLAGAGGQAAAAYGGAKGAK